MKQLGLGIMQYTQDHDERFPAGYYFTTWVIDDRTGLGWGEDIFPYVKSKQVYVCPSEYNNKIDLGGPDRVSYAFNGGLNMPLGPNGNYVGTIAALNASAKTVMLLECASMSATLDNTTNGAIAYASPVTWGLPSELRWAVTGGGAWFATGFMGGRGGNVPADPNAQQSTAYSNAGYFQYKTGRHLEGANFLMADGHVKWFKGDAVSTGKAAGSAASAQTTNTSYPTDSLAEGTQYSGAGAHAVTFSAT